MKIMYYPHENYKKNPERFKQPFYVVMTIAVVALIVSVVFVMHIWYFTQKYDPTYTLAGMVNMPTVLILTVLLTVIGGAICMVRLIERYKQARIYQIAKYITDTWHTTPIKGAGDDLLDTIEPWLKTHRGIILSELSPDNQKFLIIEKSNMSTPKVWKKIGFEMAKIYDPISYGNKKNKNKYY